MSAFAAQAPRDFPERRHFHRIPVDLLGRFMLENRSEFPCRVRDISPGDAAVLAAAQARLGERVIFYVDQLGRMEGTVRRLFQGGFAVDLAMSDRKREKMAAQLTWLANRHELNLPEDRRHERLQPKNPMIDITLDDGRKYKVKIMDLSLSGAAVQSAVRPAVGSRVVLGHTQGRVVRLLEEGFAIEFAVAQTTETISDL
ncbi:PilZ domain-containing protein [Aureimonas leprariae]|uniref:PilZ domain-containing protein n=1 Tax=Plantimonas leprariae TaxID=2615207 RepID=A0A7V7PQW2_9HYPH|nr:PilZ domain-containing protein [Aureimonas leprariae]KAB0680767.1 PilZ domain-containing protein [Aureimonas leprariae]